MRESFLLRIGSDPPARVWSGVGDLEIPADAVESSPATYSGAGEMLNAPDFQQLINGVAERLDFTVSGVTQETVKLAIEEAASVKGARIHLGTCRFDDDWQLIEVEWETVLRADKITISGQAQDGGRTRTIGLSAGTDDTDRSRSPNAFWTDADQKRRSPTDLFFSHVAGISGGTSRRFGPT